MRLLVATRSAHKLAEIRSILGALHDVEVVGLDDVGLPPSPEEDELEPWATFRENARSKAEYFHARTGLPTVADDSGIEVDALGGAPGVRSKRFAPGAGEGTDQDEANNAHLLERLRGVPSEERGARYVCVAALCQGPDADVEYFEGTIPGRILEAPRGQGGFGYDPLFHVESLGRTFGEAGAEEKNALSHRGAAFRALRDRLATD